MLTGTYTAIARQFHSNLVSVVLVAGWRGGWVVGGTARVEVEENCEGLQWIFYYLTYTELIYAISMRILQMPMYVTSCY